MNNIRIITWFTLREAFARKVFIFFWALSALALIITLIIFSSGSTVDFITGVKNAKLDFTVTDLVRHLELIFMTPLTGLCILFSIFVTASFVPIMVEKGNIDLLLSKPVSRDQLLLGKYLGGLLVVFLNIAFLVLGVWLIISLKFSYWNYSFLWAIILITFSFAILYAVIVLIGVLTKGSILGMMVSYLIYLVISPVLNLLYSNSDIFISSHITRFIIKVFYYIIPQTSEVSGTLTNEIVLGKSVENYNPVWISLIFIILTMGIAISIFRKKDF